MTRPQGPWVKKLIVRFISKMAIPDGGGFADGIRFLSDPDAIKSTAKIATLQAFAAIDYVRSAPDCKWTTDDEIAEQIVTAIEKKIKAHLTNSGECGADR